MDAELPEPFDSRFKDILKKFESMKETYGYYDDGRLPQDNEYVKEILQFLITILDYMEINFKKADLDQWALFLSSIPEQFNYAEDNHNYLELEGIDLVAILLKFDEEPTILQISTIRKKLERAMQKF
jgi:hypothetical protein